MRQNMLHIVNPIFSSYKLVVLQDCVLIQSPLNIQVIFSLVVKGEKMFSIAKLTVKSF